MEGASDGGGVGLGLGGVRHIGWVWQLGDSGHEVMLINFANILPYISLKLHVFLFHLKLSELKSLEE